VRVPTEPVAPGQRGDQGTGRERFQIGSAAAPRVESVFDETQAASAPAPGTPGYLDVTYTGLPPISGPAGGGFTSTVKRYLANARALPRALQIGVAGGVVALLIAVIVVVASGGSGPGTGTHGSPSATKTPSQPLIAIQTFHDKRGLTIDVPAGWHKASATSYTDFTDPNDPGRRLRINVERSGSDTPEQFLQVAERGLRNPKRCTSPYQQVSLVSTTLGGRPGAIMEYTCGSGTGKRHGIWGAMTLNGHAYHFYLTVPDSEFATSKVIFQEMADSFKLTAPAI
jgi:hypothetical protein